MRSKLIDRLVEEKKEKPVILGHRGIRKEVVPENTIAAFEEALKRGASGIEIDVESTSDGNLIVINRWYLHSQFGFFPWEKSLETIQKLAEKKSIEIPTFFETCDFIKKKRNTIFNVEIKSSHRFVCQTARKAVKIIHDYKIDAQVIISSFDINTLLTTRFFHRKIETAYLFRKVDRVVKLEDRNKLRYKVNSMINRTGIKGFFVGIDSLHPEITLFPSSTEKEKNWMKVARWMGKRVNAWTVDTNEDLSKAINAGVKIIISDKVKTVI
ncbi:MAG: glycerophosphodiester phosphodiesterase [Desulfobacterales bacterium]|nr:glycerophosphodiester phosphodiesterase [Desulfobacterales bacterium]